jgi:hypothetical protein
LVYRNSGRTSVNADVGWDTFSIYESTTTGVTTARMEVYGAYLTAAGVIIAPAAGSGRVSFVMWSNSDGFILATGYRYTVTASENIHPFISSEWDYQEQYDKSGTDEYTRKVSGKALGAPYPDVFQEWDIRQIIDQYLQLSDATDSYIYGSAVASFAGAPGTLFASDGPNYIYYDNTFKELWSVSNAYWDIGAEWTGTVSPVAAAFCVGKGYTYQFVKTNTSSPWAQYAWDAKQKFDRTGNTQSVFADPTVADTAIVSTGLSIGILGMLVVAVDVDPGSGLDIVHISATYQVQGDGSISLIGGDSAIWGTSVGSKSYNVYSSGGHWVFQNVNGMRSVSVVVAAYLVDTP